MQYDRKTTIQVTTDLKNKITVHGKFGESINDILERIVDKANICISLELKLGHENIQKLRDLAIKHNMDEHLFMSMSLDFYDSVKSRNKKKIDNNNVDNNNIIKK